MAQNHELCKPPKAHENLKKKKMVFIFLFKIIMILESFLLVLQVPLSMVSECLHVAKLGELLLLLLSCFLAFSWKKTQTLNI